MRVIILLPNNKFLHLLELQIMFSLDQFIFEFLFYQDFTPAKLLLK